MLSGAFIVLVVVVAVAFSVAFMVVPLLRMGLLVLVLLWSARRSDGRDDGAAVQTLCTASASAALQEGWPWSRGVFDGLPIGLQRQRFAGGAATSGSVRGAGRG